jgi:molybdate transport system substrate-binding protein
VVRRSVLLTLLYALFACAAVPAFATDVMVFAAASLKESLDENARKFESETGHRVVVSYGPSNGLAKQIENGGPADLFISADLDWMDYLDTRRLLMPNTRRNLLGNELVLIAPAASTATLKIGRNFDLAGALGKERLAMANPDSVPAGKYGKRALDTLGVWSSVESRVARADTVRVALTLVSRGEAPFGIVYRTDALADPRVRVVDAFPPDTYPTIVYPVAVVAGAKSQAAVALLGFLGSANAQAVWRKHGFGTVR